MKRSRFTLTISNDGADTHSKHIGVRSEYFEDMTGARRQELEKGFFERQSTKDHIAKVSELNSLSVFAGAGVSADLGVPTWAPFMRQLLALVLAHEPMGPASEATETRQRRADTVVTALVTAEESPSFLGSVVRERFTNLTSSTSLAEMMGTISQRGRSPGGFLARSVCNVALAFKSAGRTAVILTSNYDEEIEQAQAHVHRNSPGLATISLSCCSDAKRLKTAAEHPARVPVAHLNGRLRSSDETLVVGEADFFVRSTSRGKPSKKASWREETVHDILATDGVLFVGTSMSDPDMLAHLARTKHLGKQRYAIITRPQLEDVDPALRPLVWDLLEARYRHLGVEPIQVDFHHQVPQFLREVALKVQLGDGYEAYSDRLNRWWKPRSTGFGYGSEGSRDETTLRSFYEKLYDVRRSFGEWLRLKGWLKSGERLMVELWIRHPHDRCLFNWASSDGMWLDAHSALQAPIEGTGRAFHCQEAFRRGTTIASALRSTRTPWRYQITTPLVLHEEPWSHLPVGCLTILSNRGETDEEAALPYIVADPARFQEALDFVKGETLQLLA